MALQSIPSWQISLLSSRPSPCSLLTDSPRNHQHLSKAVHTVTRNQARCALGHLPTHSQDHSPLPTLPSSPHQIPFSFKLPPLSLDGHSRLYPPSAFVPSDPIALLPVVSPGVSRAQMTFPGLRNKPTLRKASEESVPINIHRLPANHTHTQP